MSALLCVPFYIQAKKFQGFSGRGSSLREPGLQALGAPGRSPSLLEGSVWRPGCHIPAGGSGLAEHRIPEGVGVEATVWGSMSRGRHVPILNDLPSDVVDAPS